MQQTVSANDMESGVHIRLMVTRGPKKAPNQDPRNALGKPTVVIVAEHKEPSEEIVTRGLKLVTSGIRCTPKEMFDMRLNSHSRLSLIRAFLDVMGDGADEALMLDPVGFVSSCNATNFFSVKNGVLRTSTGEFCFNGVTRANVIALAEKNGVPLKIANFTLDDIHASDEAFVTGTFGGITPVREIDGYTMPQTLPGLVTTRLRSLYARLKDADAAR
ncbi:MAG: aminotransferase class IV [Rhizomicrobium sp.]